ncbi:MAG: 4-(cytidine 5'-diphospho)-2-C-methyl-D-erythritol kinase [Verrucomicrobia bacterium]|nr:4-(cytidine 5'-diphospho)-2-C-methyl-D-erythritol kinase [Verrucomicrobiota bacterium]
MFSSPAVTPLELSCPAKLNLCLAVTGRRADGFHELVSVAAPLALADTLRVEPAGEFRLACDDPAVPVDDSNLVLRAAAEFRRATGWTGGARFQLAKRVPMGAGLGGGSSDGAAALRALNALAGHPLTPAELAGVAARVGSDCPLFLAGGPVVMRGRGERIEPLPPEAARRLFGRRVVVFKPGFGIATPWAYQRLAAEAPAGYLPPAEAEERVAGLVRALERDEDLGARLFNSLERPAFAKFVALPVLLGQLRQRFGVAARMSGSGSACFALLSDGVPAAAITATVRAAWGPSAFVAETNLL